MVLKRTRRRRRTRRRTRIKKIKKKSSMIRKKYEAGYLIHHNNQYSTKEPKITDPKKIAIILAQIQNLKSTSMLPNPDCEPLVQRFQRSINIKTNC